MKITAPFEPLHEHFPRFRRANSESTKKAIVDDSDPLLSLPDEAERVEAARTELLTLSDKIRLGLDPHPEQTVRALGQTAEMLATSEAPDWEKATTLSETAANLQGGHVEITTSQHIIRLAIVTLRLAYPRNPDPYTDQLNKDELKVHTDAMTQTSPQVSYTEALEKKWVELNHPLDPLIDRTEELVDEMYDRQHRVQILTERTGRYDPWDLD